MMRTLPRITSFVEWLVLPLFKSKSDAPTTTKPMITNTIPTHSRNFKILLRKILENIPTNTITAPEIIERVKFCIQLVNLDKNIVILAAKKLNYRLCHITYNLRCAKMNTLRNSIKGEHIKKFYQGFLNNRTSFIRHERKFKVFLHYTINKIGFIH